MPATTKAPTATAAASAPTVRRAVTAPSTSTAAPTPARSPKCWVHFVGVNVMTASASSSVTTIRCFGPRRTASSTAAAASSVTSTAARRPIEPWKPSASR